MQNIVILFSGEGSNLEVLITKLHKKSCNIVCAMTNKPKAKGIIKAQKLGVHVEVLDNRLFESRELFDTALVKLIHSYRADLVVLAGFMRILTPIFTSQIKAINLHPSLLPLFKGANAIQESFESEEKEGGITVHYVNSELDGGEIILQKSFMKSEDESIESFTHKIHLLEYNNFYKAVELIV